MNEGDLHLAVSSWAILEGVLFSRFRLRERHLEIPRGVVSVDGSGLEKLPVSVFFLKKQYIRIYSMVPSLSPHKP